MRIVQNLNSFFFQEVCTARRILFRAERVVRTLSETEPISRYLCEQRDLPVGRRMQTPLQTR